MLPTLLGSAVAEIGKVSGAGDYANKFDTRFITVTAIAFGTTVFLDWHTS